MQVQLVSKGEAVSRVLVCGAVNLDITMNITRFPHPGETLVDGRVTYAQGGKGANQAVAAAKAGGRASFTGAVGDDAFGRKLAAELREKGVDLHLEKSATHSTGVAVILVDTKGESSVVVDLGANQILGPGVAEIAAIDSTDVVLVQNEIPLAASRAFAASGRRAGATVVLNASPFSPACIRDAQSGDYLIFNEVEFSQYLGIPVGTMSLADIEAALDRQADADMPHLIVTVGSEGVRARTGSQLHNVRGHTVEAVDTTGAGDCFCGSFAAALVAGMAPDRCLAFANAAAAISVQSPGAGPSMPSYEQTAAFLEQHLRRA